jgi:hypothetical protein
MVIGCSVGVAGGKLDVDVTMDPQAVNSRIAVNAMKTPWIVHMCGIEATPIGALDAGEIKFRRCIKVRFKKQSGKQPAKFGTNFSGVPPFMQRVGPKDQSLPEHGQALNPNDHSGFPTSRPMQGRIFV